MKKNIEYYGDYSFKNYINLSYEEKVISLDFRNKNKAWMINTKEIGLEEHLRWCDKLKDNNSQIYYLVFKENIPFMAIDYHDIDYTRKEAYWGYFLGLDTYKSEVLKIEKIIIDIAFNKLGLKKLLCINDINNHVINIHKFFGFKEDGIIQINDRDFLKMSLINNNGNN
jgi:RimJ/RimL family protein N-acetyltransferase